MTRPLTAYPATEAALTERFAGARLDAGSFARPLARCDLRRCGGMCCREGVYVNEETARVLADLWRDRWEWFETVGLDAVGPAVVREDLPSPAWHTALTPRADGTAACAFLLGDARCSLQVLAGELGLHPWHFKPLACWLHPVALTPEAIRLPGDEAGPASPARPHPTTRAPGGPLQRLAPRTGCGRTDPGGLAAHTVLGAELRFLGLLLGRDLEGELATNGQ